MTKPEVSAVALQDPFTRYYATAWLGMAQTNRKILEQYNNATFGQEITNILEYLKISNFFQSSLEPVIGVSTIFLFLTRLVDFSLEYQTSFITEVIGFQVNVPDYFCPNSRASERERKRE